MSVILALGVSADALACGYAAGASGLRIPLRSALCAAMISAATVALGMATGHLGAPFLPASLQTYISFAVLAVFGLCKLAGSESKPASQDFNCDRILSVPEAVGLGSMLSVDGLAVGFGAMQYGAALWICAGCTLAFTALSLYYGAKGGKGARGSRLGDIVAGLALVALAALKLVFA